MGFKGDDIYNYLNSKLVADQSIDSSSKSADVVIKLCTSCNQTWESYFCRNINKTRTVYHGSTMPSYGKERKNCPRCEAIKANKLIKFQGV